MKPLLMHYTTCEDGGEGSNKMMEKQSELNASLFTVLDSVGGLWEGWQIHCLVLLSLSLQVFLFLTAGMRRRSTSGVLRILLWLAYLSADSVAVYVLGHLTVHVSGPSHSLMFFWAPFMIVHLGGQDTITAFSKEDNELWRRHLLNLVFQAAVAAYVVTKASWTDRRLMAAMVLIFLSGCIKYAERIWCLFISSAPKLKIRSVRRLFALEHDMEVMLPSVAVRETVEILGMMEGSRSWQRVPGVKESLIDMLSADVPPNEPRTILAKGCLPDLLNKFLSSRGDAGCRASYVCVGECLTHCYQFLYTKKPIRSMFYQVLVGGLEDWGYIKRIVFLLGTLFQYASSTIALKLFMGAKKGEHANLADIIVSYILLVGAIALDVSSITVSILPDSFQLPCCPKQWSKELPQYNIMAEERDSSVMACLLKPCLHILSAFGVDLFETTHVPLTKDMRKFVFDKLVSHGTRKEWGIASSRGQLALKKALVMGGSDGEVDQGFSRSGQALYKGQWEALQQTTSSSADFPESVLIWHIATALCLRQRKARASSHDHETKKHMDISRELSSYIMYVVFKCSVMLNSHSLNIHRRTRREISYDPYETSIKKLEEVASWNFEHLNRNEPAVKPRASKESSVLLKACKLTLELTSINDETRRWDFIASVWSEMLYYIAPRCGGAFHYEHLATGGEFATHVLLLMNFLGPFLPGPDAVMPIQLPAPSFESV